MKAELALAEHAIAVAIAHAAEHALVDIRAKSAAEQERQNRSFAQLQRFHRERCAAARYRFRNLLGSRR